MKTLYAFLVAVVVMIVMQIGNQFLHYGEFIIGWISCAAYLITERELKPVKNN